MAFHVAVDIDPVEPAPIMCSDPVAASKQDMVFGKLTITDSSQGPRARLREALELHARAGVKTAVEPYRLDDALTAFERVESGA
ncbi:MAG: hypothetical protein ACR2OD_09495, partial [Gaiellaceae bacterium]